MENIKKNLNSINCEKPLGQLKKIAIFNQNSNKKEVKKRLGAIFLGLLTTALITAFGNPSASAHSLWLETDQAPKADQILDITVGFNEGFEVVDIIKEADGNISNPIVLGPEGTIATKPKGEPNYAFQTEKELPAGSYLAFTEYKPFEMGHGEGKGPKNKYFMSSKHVINIGVGSDEIVTKPQNKASLEIIPLKNTSELKAGGFLPIQVLFEGKPLAKATVLGDFRGYNPAGSWGLAKAFYCNTDKDGKADFLPVKGGLWILKVRHAIPNEDPKLEFKETVHLGNITFYVAD